uniref:Conserved oligomeric Golgi complex subunit 2 n=1 Tax=Dracunculus medinensis TaxID=318479 RepID=A0A0N4U0G9_DRAME
LENVKRKMEENAKNCPSDSNISRVLFSNQLNKSNESTLCFNKAHFSRSDFNVERFINLARRRANLSQIHNDLRVYLKIVQNSMIELINDDYADFVNLSSSLVGLKDSIEKLNKDVESIWDDFFSSTSSLISAATNIEKYSIDLAECRQLQICIRSKISLIKAIERLSEILNNKPDELDGFWMSKLADSIVDLELWYKKVGSIDDKLLQLVEARSSCIVSVREIVEQWLIYDLEKDCQHINVLLGILILTDSLDSTVSKVMTEIIDCKIEKRRDDLERFLYSIFAEIKKMRKHFISKAKKNGNCNLDVTAFLDKCLLTYVMSILDQDRNPFILQYFGSVLIPSDNRLFHRCFLSTCEFISSWPNPASSRIVLRMIRDKFNLLVYFKLETQHILAELKESTIYEKINLIEHGSEIGNEKLYYQYSVIVINAFGRIWSDDVFLPPLIDKFWDFSIKLLSSYLGWLDKISRYSLAAVERNDDNIESWRLLCALRSDAATLDARIFDLALLTVWKKIREIEVVLIFWLNIFILTYKILDVTTFGQCLSFFSSRIAEKIEDLEKSSIEKVAKNLSKILEGVSDIPRHYRWTKKPFPAEASIYIIEAFSAFSDFQNEVGNRHWPSESIINVSRDILRVALIYFCKKAEQVLDSVEQTGSSLQRFKRRTTNLSDQSNTDTDENKIRNQLLFDLAYCLDWASNHSLELPVIVTLMERAKNVDVAIKEKVSAPAEMH